MSSFCPNCISDFKDNRVDFSQSDYQQVHGNDNIPRILERKCLTYFDFFFFFKLPGIMSSCPAHYSIYCMCILVSSLV